MDLVVEEINL